MLVNKKRDEKYRNLVMSIDEFIDRNIMQLLNTFNEFVLIIQVFFFIVRDNLWCNLGTKHSMIYKCTLKYYKY